MTFMVALFYIFSVIAVISTIGVVLSVCPVYALSYLIVSFLSISCIFFILGAYFAGALEVIIYAGAIVVLFVFVVMLLNIDFSMQRVGSLITQYDFRMLLLVFIFLVMFLFFIWNPNNDFYVDNNVVDREFITLKNVGISLFSRYVLLVEMASLLLLGALVISLHIGRFSKKNKK